MKQIKLLLVVLIFANTNIYSQTCTNPTINSTDSNRVFTDPTYLNTNTSVCINVFFHILRNDSGVGNFNSAELINVTNILNEAYNPHNFFIML